MITNLRLSRPSIATALLTPLAAERGLQNAAHRKQPPAALRRSTAIPLDEARRRATTRDTASQRPVSAEWSRLRLVASGAEVWGGAR